jgi:hypothetical protein
VPHAIKYNLPANSKVIQHWTKHWEDLPDSPLLAEIWQLLRDTLAQRRPKLVQAFEEACPRPPPERLARPAGIPYAEPYAERLPVPSPVLHPIPVAVAVAGAVTGAGDTHTSGCDDENCQRCHHVAALALAAAPPACVSPPVVDLSPAAPAPAAAPSEGQEAEAEEGLPGRNLEPPPAPLPAQSPEAPRAWLPVPPPRAAREHPPVSAPPAQPPPAAGQPELELEREAPGRRDEVDALRVAWNELGPGLVRWEETSRNRRKAAKARLREHGLEKLCEAIRRAQGSAWCRGEAPGANWPGADADWFLKPDSLNRLLEGKYDGKKPLPRDFRKGRVGAEEVDWKDKPNGVTLGLG